MTWTPITEDEEKHAQRVLLWIKTVRAAQEVRHPGMHEYGPDWLPSFADIHKSALYERIRSGKAPLPFPPPLGLACPWYAAVEDPAPHYLGRTMEEGVAGDGVRMVRCDWSAWRVVSGPRAMAIDGSMPFYIVADPRHRTPYRWKLWSTDWTEVVQHQPGPAVYLQRVTDDAA